MTIKDFIKSQITKEGLTMSKVVRLLNEKYNKKESIQNFSNKLTRETLRYKEAEEIADIIGYKIEWVRKF